MSFEDARSGDTAYGREAGATKEQKQGRTLSDCVGNTWRKSEGYTQEQNVTRVGRSVSAGVEHLLGVPKAPSSGPQCF